MATRKISPKPEEITRLLFDLGPRTCIIVEGNDDLEVFHEWYRDFQDRLMFWPAFGDTHVRVLVEEVLAISRTKRVYGIIDRDFRPDEAVESSLTDPDSHLFILRRYSIENYVLDPEALQEELRGFYGTKRKAPTKASIERKLLEICRQLRTIMAANWVLIEADSESKHFPSGYDVNVPRNEVIQHVAEGLGTTVKDAGKRVQEKERLLDARLTTLGSAHTCTNGKHLLHQAYAFYIVPVKPTIPRDHLLKLLARTIKEKIGVHSDIKRIVEDRVLQSSVGNGV